MQNLRSALLLSLCSFVFFSCSSGLMSSAGVDNSTMETITAYVKIDDEYIDQNNSYAIIDPVWWTATIYDGEQKYNESLARFSKEQRFLFAVTWYFAEVDNGGHDQFDFNSTGIVWKDALAGLKELDIEEAAKIIEESAARMGGNPSLDRATRQAQLDTYEPDFSDLDSRLYKLENEINIEEIMHKYILQHRSAFYFEGEVQKPK